MDNVATIDFGAGSSNLVLSLLSRPAGKTLRRVRPHRESEKLHPANDLHSKQLDDGICGRFLSGNGQRLLGGCRPLVQGPISRCSRAERLHGESHSSTARLQKPQPEPIGRVSFGKRNQVGWNWTSRATAILYTGCWRMTEAKVFLRSDSSLPGYLGSTP